MTELNNILGNIMTRRKMVTTEKENTATEIAFAKMLNDIAKECYIPGYKASANKRNKAEKQTIIPQYNVTAYLIGIDKTIKKLALSTIRKIRRVQNECNE